MIGERVEPESPALERDVVDDLRDWIARGSVPTGVASRALMEIERLRGLVGAVTSGPTFDEIKRQSRVIGRDGWPDFAPPKPTSA